MKKIISSLFLGSSLIFAGNLYNKEIDKRILPISFKIATQKLIIDTDIRNDNKKVLVATNYKIKIFDIASKELEKILAFQDIKKVKFSNDNSKIFILTKEKFYIYDSQNYQQLVVIKGKDFRSFNLSPNNKFLALFDNKTDKTTIYNLINGKEISNIKLSYVENIAFSPNSKNIAISKYHELFIYNLKGELLNKLPTFSEHIKKMSWVTNDILDVLGIAYKDSYIYRFNTKTAQIITQTPNFSKSGIDYMLNLNKNNDLIGNNEKIQIFNFKQKKVIQEYTGKNNNKYDDILSMDLSKNGKLLVVGYESYNAKIYNINLSNFINKNGKIETYQIPTNTTNNSPIIKEKIIEKKVIVEKKVYVKDTSNKKPTLELYASQTSGYAPLTVNFKILANDSDGKIVSYYINFAGKEVIGKGNPNKQFSHTFENTGKYNIMVAVKDNKGEITTKKIVIKVREESFEDFKKGLFGR